MKTILRQKQTLSQALLQRPPLPLLRSTTYRLLAKISSQGTKFFPQTAKLGSQAIKFELQATKLKPQAAKIHLLATKKSPLETKSLCWLQINPRKRQSNYYYLQNTTRKPQNSPISL